MILEEMIIMQFNQVNGNLCICICMYAIYMYS